MPILRAGRSPSTDGREATWVGGKFEQTLYVVEAEDVAGSSETPSEIAPERWRLDALEGLAGFLERNRQAVFFFRQLEVIHEDHWFHWVTNRAIRDLIADGLARTEQRQLANGSPIHLVWHRSYRYYRRDASRLVELVNEYAAPNIGAALGLQGELLVLEGIARHEFVMRGRNTRQAGGRVWTRSEHDLDFVFEADGIGYGVEVKNTLGYMDHDELQIKSELCQHLGLRPLFVARMLPRSWIHEVNLAGGFALVLKYQLYPWAHRDLAKRVRTELLLPVDSPRALEQGTTERFLRWHREHR